MGGDYGRAQMRLVVPVFQFVLPRGEVEHAPPNESDRVPR